MSKDGYEQRRPGGRHIDVGSQGQTQMPAPGATTVTSSMPSRRRGVQQKLAAPIPRMQPRVGSPGASTTNVDMDAAHRGLAAYQEQLPSAAPGDTRAVQARREIAVDAVPPRSGSWGPVQRREAAGLERRAWLAFFDHYLPRKFLNNYMDDKGASITLTPQEMQDCNPVADIRRSERFLSFLANLQAMEGGTQTFSRLPGPAGALTNGTLGNFTIYWTGTLTVRGDGSWAFQGTMEFYDFWDFDPKGEGSNRPFWAEAKVRVADLGLPGRPFHIYSEAVPVHQTSADAAVQWGAGAPVHVPDRMEQTGADIVVGDVAGVGLGVGVAGDVGAGLGGGAGAESGAQGAEDTN